MAKSTKESVIAETKKAMANAVKKSNEAGKTKKVGKKSYVRVTAGIEWWKPSKKGDTIEVQLVEFMDYKDNFSKEEGAKVRKAICKKEDGTQIGMPSHASLMNQLKGCEGKELLIEFLGEELKKGATKGARNSTFMNYAVYELQD